MKRDEALRLVGRQVGVWTAANGKYNTTVVEILPRSPWRARVRVTTIAEPAQHFERGQACRRGFRVGEELEVGHSSVLEQPYEGAVEDYAQACERQAERFEDMYRRYPNGPNAWVMRGYSRALRAAAQAELHRLAGQPWKLAPDLEDTSVVPAGRKQEPPTAP